MSRYYYSNGSQKTGPISLEELQKLNLTETTLVWREGLSKWMEARAFPELKDSLREEPPMLPEELLKFNRKQKLNETTRMLSVVVFSRKLWIRYFYVSCAFSVIVIMGGLLSESHNSSFPVYRTNYERNHPILTGIKFIFITFFTFAIITLIIGIIQSMFERNLNSDNNSEPNNTAILNNKMEEKNEELISNNGTFPTPIKKSISKMSNDEEVFIGILLIVLFVITTILVIIAAQH